MVPPTYWSSQWTGHRGKIAKPQSSLDCGFFVVQCFHWEASLISYQQNVYPAQQE